MIRSSLEDRFFNKVNKTSTCWLWTGCTKRYGYIAVGGGRSEAAHRVSYRLHYGEFDRTLKVLHRCDNPPCVNPEHLFLGTQDDNMKDCKAKGRTPTGSKHTSHKLSDSDVVKIIELSSSKNTKTLSEMFGVNPRYIRKIVTGERRVHD